MAKSVCCEFDVIGRGGNQSVRRYYCTKCKKECDVTKSAHPPPSVDPIINQMSKRNQIIDNLLKN